MQLVAGWWICWQALREGLTDRDTELALGLARSKCSWKLPRTAVCCLLLLPGLPYLFVLVALGLLAVSLRAFRPKISVLPSLSA